MSTDRLTPTVSVTVRVPTEISAWVDSYAASRGVKRSAVIVAALRGFRDLCAGGVPELGAVSEPKGRHTNEQADPRPVPSSEGVRSAPPPTAVPGPVRVDSVPEASRVVAGLRQSGPPDLMRERQARLNKQLGR